MKIPYRLRRTNDVRETRALLVPGHDGAAVLSLCAHLGIDSPRIFAVADGFLLRVDKSVDKPVAGAIRLGELAPNLLLPVDADLVPALLADEADALGRRRGLVFLPDGRVLEFAPAETIELGALVTIEGLRPRPWTAFPEPPTLASRITEIIYHRPEDLPDVIIESGGDGIAEEKPRPDDASLAKKMLGKSAMGLGQTLGWLGNALNVKSLASLGGALMAGGLALVPRLSEKIMGKQEAGLRDLLEDFRNGNIERALRRALPLGGAGARGTSPHQGTQLPTHDLGYSLGNILGGWGPASLWYTPDQLYFELQREYRKQAEAATQRGDYRRAAFIYGKLLGDYATAAAALAQGGLHHDAAILYLKLLHDYLAAAREFEAAGEFDQALSLYRQRQEHVHAGDLLRRMGEDEIALAEYKQAAIYLIKGPSGYCQAGELMLNKAGRPDLAEHYFLAGWQARPVGSAVPCARHLARMYAQRADHKAMLQLTEDAQAFFQSPGNEVLASEFCNEVARLAERPALAPIQETVRDRCLMTLAHKMRQGWDNMGQLAFQLFGAGSVWETPLVDDAHFAAKIARRRGAPWVAKANVSTIVIPGRIPIVRSVCHAAETGELFLGFESGEIACYHPRRGDIHNLAPQPGAVHGLAVDPAGAGLVALTASDDSNAPQISCYTRHGQWQLEASRPLEHMDGYWLCPVLVKTRDHFASLFDAGRGELRFLRLPRLLPEGSIALEECYPLTGIPLILRDSSMSHFSKGSIRGGAYVLFDGRELVHVAHTQGQKATTRRVLCSIPAPSASSSLEITPLSWMSTGPGSLEVVGIGAEGVLTWLDLEFRPEDLKIATSKSIAGPFRAAALVRKGVVAAVASDGIVWLRAVDSGIKEQLRQRYPFPDVVACYPNNEAAELMVVSGNGTVARVHRAV